MYIYLINHHERQKTRIGNRKTFGKKLHWKKGSDVTYTSLLNSRNFLLVHGRFLVSNPFTTVATAVTTTKSDVVVVVVAVILVAVVL